MFDELGKITGFGEAAYTVEHPNPGWAEQQADWWWKALVSSFRKMLGVAPSCDKNLGGISITHQRYSFVPVDENIEPIYPAILWCDKPMRERGGRGRFHTW